MRRKQDLIIKIYLAIVTLNKKYYYENGIAFKTNVSQTAVMNTRKKKQKTHVRNPRQSGFLQRALLPTHVKYNGYLKNSCLPSKDIFKGSYYLAYKLILFDKLSKTPCMYCLFSEGKNYPIGKFALAVAILT